MPVYVEPVAVTPDGRRVSRLRADSAVELDRFVDTAGIVAPKVGHATVPAMTHYELGWRDRRRAVRAGAQECDWADTYRRLARLIVAGGPKPVAPGV